MGELSLPVEDLILLHGSCVSVLKGSVRMDVFVSRDSEAIIPNIFFFLVLLSYERYHSKQIIGIPKIIQLCDGIMASGRKAVTHGNGRALGRGSLLACSAPMFSLLCCVASVCACARGGAHSLL